MKRYVSVLIILLSLTLPHQLLASSWELIGEESLVSNAGFSQQIEFNVWENKVYSQIKIEFLRDGVEIDDVYVYTYSNFRWDIPTLVGDYTHFRSKTAPLGISSPIKSVRILVKGFPSNKMPILRVYLKE